MPQPRGQHVKIHLRHAPLMQGIHQQTMNDRAQTRHSLQPLRLQVTPDGPRYWRQSGSQRPRPGYDRPTVHFPDGAARAGAAGWCPDSASILTRSRWKAYRSSAWQYRAVRSSSHTGCNNPSAVSPGPPHISTVGKRPIAFGICKKPVIGEPPGMVNSSSRSEPGSRWAASSYARLAKACACSASSSPLIWRISGQCYTGSMHATSGGRSAKDRLPARPFVATAWPLSPTQRSSCRRDSR
ncbi:Uncharacterised protein [Klebsiella variicola]|uniref:Uncharacterized protein n=1 Tax=Klebsiella variicola TaxID=244366 RepID=A0A7H4MDY5_KLEVA|nr:Uncharacterised protein [Klebsiella variicola]